jgi:hypothetical protein
MHMQLGLKLAGMYELSHKHFPVRKVMLPLVQRADKSIHEINCEVICIVIHLPSVQAFCERNQSPHCQLGGPVLLI